MARRAPAPAQHAPSDGAARRVRPRDGDREPQRGQRVDGKPHADADARARRRAAKPAPATATGRSHTVAADPAAGGAHSATGNEPGPDRDAAAARQRARVQRALVGTSCGSARAAPAAGPPSSALTATRRPCRGAQTGTAARQAHVDRAGSVAPRMPGKGGKPAETGTDAGDPGFAGRTAAQAKVAKMHHLRHKARRNVAVNDIFFFSIMTLRELLPLNNRCQDNLAVSELRTPIRRAFLVAPAQQG